MGELAGLDDLVDGLLEDAYVMIRSAPARRIATSDSIMTRQG